MFNNHNHSEFSNAQLGFVDSINKLESLIQRAYDIGLDGIALTDHEGIQGHIKAWKYYKDMQRDRDFKLALGNEIYLMSEEQWEGNQNLKNENPTPYYHFVLTALDDTGHKQIRELSTRAWSRAKTIKGFMRKPTFYTDIENVIRSNQGHVVGSSACLGSRLDKLILEWQQSQDNKYKKDIHIFITWCIDVFGKDNFYLEIQPCNEDNTEQILVNKVMWQLSEAYDLKLIVTTDSHYLYKDQAFVHKVLLQSKEGDREVDQFYATAYLMDERELREYMRLSFTDEQIDIMFNNSMDIYNKVQEYNFEHAPIIPEIPKEHIPDFKIKHIFKDWYDKYEYFKWYATQADYIHDQYFFYRIEEALQSKVVDKGLDIETYIDRCNTEFKELKLLSESFNSSMASYYSTFKDIINIIWDSDSLSMPGRGSSCAFLITYLLDITQINPVPLGEYMPYWRHLSHERGVEIADIDNDSQASKRDVILENIKKYFGYDKVLSVSTYSTLTTKTAIERAIKGLKLNDDLGGYLKSLVPVERGSIWSVHDCIYGNEEKGRKPIREFVEQLQAHNRLQECIEAFEGLVVNRGIHASGIIITNQPYINHIAGMCSPNNVMCTCYDLHDCEYCGVVKVDMLTIQAADKIRATLDLLVEHNKIEWQGNIKNTYWKYIHPDVLEYDNKDMWKCIKSIYSVFQFDTSISVQALNNIEPQSVMELSAANSLLRLQTSDVEQPLETYIRYKNNLDEWKKDCDEWGLTDDERNILKHYLSDSYMLADCQEKVMRLSMDNRVAGFTLKEANLLRKSIAKKDAKSREKSRKQFYDWGEKQGTRKVFLDYIWNEVFGKSFGYSFSSIHSYAYSIIALQELNLNYFYPSVYWNCGCLTVESNAFDVDSSHSNKNMDYGEMANAIYKMKRFGTDVKPPSINNSDISFTPDETTNSILFGLNGISGINVDIATEIIGGRPHTSFKDFYNGLKDGTLLTPSKIVKLIKAGCFDEFNNDRTVVMYEYFKLKHKPKSALSVANLNQCLKLGVDLPEDLTKVYRFKNYILSKEFFYCNDPQYKTKKHYIVKNEYTKKYLFEHYGDTLEENKDYYYENENLIVVDKSIDRVIKNDLNKLKAALNQEKVIQSYNNLTLRQEYNDGVKTHNVHQWSFEATSYYHYGEHELDDIDCIKYSIASFNDLSSEPKFINKSFRGRSWRQYEITRICGTVVDREDNRHTIYLLTPDNIVVGVKFNAEQYSWYKQTISIIDINGNKAVVDPSWFTRGTLLMVTGYRYGDGFRVKRYKNTVLQHSVIKIQSLDGNEPILQYNRYTEENENETV